ncbi:MAG TPA: sensor histidine kinase [Myxococcales bacterium]|nr:sensor histidine kinase [Myxococcales bacterium]
MNRRALAARLSLLVAVAGLLPIAVVGAVSLEILRRRSERSAQEALRAIAEQAAARVGTYLAQQREMLRAIAANLSTDPEAERRLEEIPLDAPSLGRMSLLGVRSPAKQRPPSLRPEQLARAFAGTEVASPVYIAQDLTPAMDVCVPARARPGHAVCASLDLLELQRLVQRISIGEHGYALALDVQGRLLASGAGALRAAVLTGEAVRETPIAQALFAGTPAPTRYVSGLGEDVIAGWAQLKEQGWAIVVEEPAREALRPAQNAQAALLSVAAAALLLSLAVGIAQSQRVLAALEIEERWKTAGRIATSISHDLGHRLAILQQTASLAEAKDPIFLPIIAQNLRSEIETLRRFVGDFADLSREVHPAEFVPLEVNAFAASVLRSAEPFAQKHRVYLKVEPSPAHPWVAGDRYLLERAVLNLLTNAIEASPQESTVVLRVSVASEPTPRALLEVVDQGAGIPASRLPGIFDAFTSTKRTGAHVGMGLANVHRIVKAHGGTASAISAPGKGSTFALSFPIAQTAGARSDAPSATG